MTDYSKGFKDYLDGEDSPANPSDEYKLGWFDAMDYESGFFQYKDEG